MYMIKDLKEIRQDFGLKYFFLGLILFLGPILNFVSIGVLIRDYGLAIAISEPKFTMHGLDCIFRILNFHLMCKFFKKGVLDSTIISVQYIIAVPILMEFIDCILYLVKIIIK